MTRRDSEPVPDLCLSVLIGNEGTDLTSAGGRATIAGRSEVGGKEKGNEQVVSDRISFPFICLSFLPHPPIHHSPTNQSVLGRGCDGDNGCEEGERQ